MREQGPQADWVVMAIVGGGDAPSDGDGNSLGRWRPWAAVALGYRSDGGRGAAVEVAAAVAAAPLAAVV